MDNENPASNRKYTITVLVSLFLLCALLVNMVDWLTRDRIAINARDHRFRILEQILTIPFDNNIHEDVIEITDPGYFLTTRPVQVFRARNHGMPVALIMMPVIARGYSGNIQLLIGVDYEGRILSVRALDHNETEGFGDQIEITESSWILSFDNLSLASTGQEDWMVRSDGGTFDVMSGATITSRGVINSVHKALEYFQANRDTLFTQN